MFQEVSVALSLLSLSLPGNASKRDFHSSPPRTITIPWNAHLPTEEQITHHSQGIFSEHQRFNSTNSTMWSIRHTPNPHDVRAIATALGVPESLGTNIIVEAFPVTSNSKQNIPHKVQLFAVMLGYNLAYQSPIDPKKTNTIVLPVGIFSIVFPNQEVIGFQTFDDISALRERERISAAMREIFPYYEDTIRRLTTDAPVSESDKILLESVILRVVEPEDPRDCSFAYKLRTAEVIDDNGSMHTAQNMPCIEIRSASEGKKLCIGSIKIPTGNPTNPFKLQVCITVEAAQAETAQSESN